MTASKTTCICILVSTVLLAACGSSSTDGTAASAGASSAQGSQPGSTDARRTAQALVQPKPSVLRGAPVEQIIVRYRTINNARLEAADPAWLTRAQSVDNVARAFANRISHLRVLESGSQLLRLNARMSQEDAYRLADQIKQLVPNVEFAEPDLVLKPMQTTTRPLPYGGSAPTDYAEQWNLQAINAEPAWNLGAPRGEGVVIGVLDSGTVRNLDLMQNMLPGYDFITDAERSQDADGRDDNPFEPSYTYTRYECDPDDYDTTIRRNNYHGAHVAGIAAAAGSLSMRMPIVTWPRITWQTVWLRGRMLGVAPGASILPVRVAGKCGASTSDVIAGFRWAIGETGIIGANNTVLAPPARPARVLNISLGAYVGNRGCPAEYQDLIQRARARNVVVVVAAGNKSIDTSLYAPANCPGVITVSAHRKGGGLASYSNFGTRPDLAAPGGDSTWGHVSSVDGGDEPYPHELDWDVPSTSIAQDRNPIDPAATYSDRRDMVGTSMAAPHVAGAAALLLANAPELTPDQVRNMLVTTADRSACNMSGCGAGLLNLVPAVQAARALNACVNQPAAGTAGETSVASGGAFTLQRGRRYSYFAWVGSTTGNFEGMSARIDVSRWDPSVNHYREIPYARVILNHGWWLDDIKDDHWPNADLDVSLILDDVHYDCRKKQWIAGTVSFGRTRYMFEPWWQMHNVNDNRHYQNIVLANGVMGDQRLGHLAQVVKNDGYTYYGTATVRFTPDSSTYR